MNTTVFLAMSLLVPLQMASAAPAGKRLNAPGPENARMAQRAGTWDVTETVWASPGAAPRVTHAVAERRAVGAFFQETLRPASGSAKVLRIDYLSYHRFEGRWKYVSMDMRDPVGIMPAESFGRGTAGEIDITFQPFAVPAAGDAVVGQLLQMTEKIILSDARHDRKDQYFVLANGTGKAWLGHRYAYTRRS